MYQFKVKHICKYHYLVAHLPNIIKIKNSTHLIVVLSYFIAKLFTTYVYILTRIRYLFTHKSVTSYFSLRLNYFWNWSEIYISCISVLTHVSLSFISQLAWNAKKKNALHILYLFQVIKLKSTGVRVMVFNATFNNISVIWCRYDLLLEETGLAEKTIDLSQHTDKLFHIP